ncbi:MAG: hypothetical protein H6719_08375 [Sandaracinaceae bacterium]|nr:hypothetical protein [Sandaracinaceae bacterium]
MQRLRILTLSSALAVATLVSACGGGGGTNEDAGPVAEDAGPVAEDAGTGPSNPLLGSVYVQPQGLGFASYHFDAEDDVYIRYETLPVPLDNGLPFPARKAFTDLRFDLSNRVFEANIDWTEQGTTVNGASRWEYRMVFSSDYSRIESGELGVFAPGGEMLDTITFGAAAPALVYRVLNDANPYPFAIETGCATFPFEAGEVVYVGLHNEATCVETFGIFAFPVGGPDCCDIAERTQSVTARVCDGGAMSFSYTFENGRLCSQPAGSGTATFDEVVTTSCAPSAGGSGVWARILPGSAPCP